MRSMRRLLVTVLVLAVLAVVADRVAAAVAQRVVAEQIAAELTNYDVDSAPPEVTVDRVPFLTQLVAGRYTSVTVRLRDVGSEEIQLPLVELTATDVAAPAGQLIRQQGPIVAERVDGTATVGYASVAALAELPELVLSADPGGELQVRLPTELLGVAVTLTGTADLTVRDGAVQVQVNSLAVEDPIRLPPGAESLVGELAQRLSLTVPLPPLPYGLTVVSARAESSGLVVEITARDVPLVR